MIVYSPFWELMHTKGITQYKLIKDYGFNSELIHRIKYDKSITMNTLNDICNRLECKVEDVILHIPDE